MPIAQVNFQTGNSQRRNLCLVGNHAQAVALAARQASIERGFAIPVYVAVPHDCSPKKIEATRACGGTVHLAGVDPAARFHLARDLSNFTGAIIVPPSDHIDIVLGQATAVAELLEQVQAVGNTPLDAVIVPSGGGGLLVGAVAACKPQGVLVYGAEPAQGGPGLSSALHMGKRSEVLDQKRTIADGLRTLTGEANWEHIKRRENVEGVYTADESEIREAMRVAAESLGIIIEPSAAVALAATLFRGDFYARIAKTRKTLRIGVILTGGNIDIKEWEDLIVRPKLAGYKFEV